MKPNKPTSTINTKEDTSKHTVIEVLTDKEKILKGEKNAWGSNNMINS